MHFVNNVLISSTQWGDVINKTLQVLGKYFEVYGQVNPITPEAGEKKKKKASFFK